MSAKAADGILPESPPPFGRKVVLGRWQALGVGLMLAVPALALAQMLGDRVERHAVRQGGWVLDAEVPVCGRDGNSLQIVVRLARADTHAGAPVVRVELSPDYLSRFTEVKRRPSVFESPGEPARPESVGPVVIELTPDRYGWARGRLAVTTETDERLELELKTFVFP